MTDEPLAAEKRRVKWIAEQGEDSEVVKDAEETSEMNAVMAQVNGQQI